jgi:8-oxo-dGTP pyrophosphatase MutT (NUDIX family)
MTDTLHPWRTRTKRTIYETSIFSLEEHERVEEESGKNGTFFVVDAPAWINVVAITTEKLLVLVEQFRHGSNRFELEIVGGDTEPDEDPQLAAIRELREETGFSLSPTSTVKLIGTTKPNPAFMTNLCYTYLVTDVEQSADQQFDEFERIRVHLVTYEKLLDLIRDGTIDHALVLTAIQWYRLNVLDT